MSEMSDLIAAIGGLAKSINDGNQKIINELQEVKKSVSKNPLDFDPEKLRASTKDAKGDGLSVVSPKDPSKPNLTPPWPDPRQPKPPGYHG
jgi:hypothetical protein